MPSISAYELESEEFSTVTDGLGWVVSDWLKQTQLKHGPIRVTGINIIDRAPRPDGSVFVRAILFYHRT
jgi:hypothetical protein